MKTISFYLISLVFFFFTIDDSLAQVGINHTEPEATLDVNGDLIVREIPLASTTPEKMLVLNNTKNKLEAINLPKSFIKGKGGKGFSILNVTLLGSWKQVSFPTIEFDENNDYDTSNQYFVAPMDGIYNIYAYAKMTSLISLSSLGIGIVKETGGTYELIADQTYQSISVVGFGVVSPPTRQIQTLVKLNQGDKIYFAIKSTNIAVFADAEAQFTIHQVK
ncbi:hypothetical protein ACFS5J_00750 [Flavobacterium chuncheonense]|uniref:C1q domain-containing protein n=1 Tax=Flavobacterium chuncheonense TaxID=2026653 RepID=A0ABW5YIH5_9FLAO